MRMACYILMFGSDVSDVTYPWKHFTKRSGPYVRHKSSAVFMCHGRLMTVSLQSQTTKEMIA